MITVALPKGRTLQPALDRFARAGVVPEEDLSSTRKLIVPARGAQARFVLLKDPDVPLYVERGAADLGVCGLDHVLESGAYRRELSPQPTDLGDMEPLASRLD